MQINIRIKKSFGEIGPDTTPGTMLHVAILKQELADIMDRAPDEHLMRTDVKQAIYRHIEASANDYRAKRMRIEAMEKSL